MYWVGGRGVRGAAVALFAVVASVACACPAQALIEHEYLTEFPGLSPTALAVGPAGAEASASEKSVLYVAGGGEVQRLSKTGVLVPFACAGAKCGFVAGGVLMVPGVQGVAVDDVTGEVFVSTAGAVDVFGGSGEDLGQITEVPAPAPVNGSFTGAAGLAFDQETNDLYIASEAAAAGNVVDVFAMKPGGTGEYVSQLGSGELTADGFLHQGVAVAEGGLGVPAGTVYVSNVDVVDVFSSLGAREAVWTGAGTQAGTFGAESIRALAMDPVTGHVYVTAEDLGVVDEMASSVGEDSVGVLSGTPAGGFGELESLAVARADGDVFVGNGGVVDVFGADVLLPEVTSEAPSGLSPTSARLNGTVSTVGTGSPASCAFDWGTSSALGHTASCTVGVAAESTAAVSVVLPGLSPDTTYFYRLQATSTKSGLTNTGEEAAAVRFTTPGPGVSNESAAGVASSSATLHADLKPNGAATSYYFQYSTASTEDCTAVSCTDVPGLPGEGVGSGTGELHVSQHVQGLAAGTVYHYRLVTISDLEVEPHVLKPETFYGADETFTTQTAGVFMLPDGRRWEMVSPPEKEGALIEAPGAPYVLQAAASGGAISYITNIPTEGGLPGYANEQQVLSTRAPGGGWASRDLASGHNGAVGGSPGDGQEFRFFSEDLSQAVVQPFGAFLPCETAEGTPLPCLSPAGSEQTANLYTTYLNNNPQQFCTSSCYQPLVTGCPAAPAPCKPAVQANANVPPGTTFANAGYAVGAGGFEGRPCPPVLFCGPVFVGATPDLRHVILKTSTALKAGGSDGLYEWSAGMPPSEQLQQVSILPREHGEEQPTTGYLGTGTPGPMNDARGAVSSDGSRVFWTSGTGQLYVRDVAKHETLEVGGPAPEFQLASDSGERVFYTENSELFVCELVEVAGVLACDTTRLGSIEGQAIGASEDGSMIYYVSAANELYVDQYTSTGWMQTPVAALSSEDAPDWADDGRSLEKLTARVSPDGRWVAFMSSRELTGYDNRDSVTGVPDEEVYLYDSETHALTCASCNPTGARPTGVEYGVAGLGMPLVAGERVWEAGVSLAADLPAWVQFEHEDARYQPRYLSDSGRLFFDSDDALVPLDVNGTWDVYEFEPVGVGSENVVCGPGAVSGSDVFRGSRGFVVEGVSGEEAAGCVALISSGASAQESVFIDASETGEDVYFLTTAKLSPQDTDNAYDIYDSHECTVVAPCPQASPTTAPVCVTVEECRSVGVTMGLTGPASTVLHSDGNVSPEPTSIPPKVTRAELLSRALKSCRKDKRRAKRSRCEKAAHKKYGVVSSSSRSAAVRSGVGRHGRGG